MVEPWVVGSQPSERFPLWTRANVGEVFPDPVSPFTLTMFMEALVEGGWRDALVEMGAFTHDEFTAGQMETLGVFGSYCYLNASITRIFGERASVFRHRPWTISSSVPNPASHHTNQRPVIRTRHGLPPSVRSSRQ